jgi:hypothetical protein
MAAAALRELRRELRKRHDMSFRELYRTLELPGASPLKDAHARLDQAVLEAYGMNKSDDVLAFLLDLNQSVANREDANEPVLGPGLPPVAEDKQRFVTSDCLVFPEPEKLKADDRAASVAAK